MLPEAARKTLLRAMAHAIQASKLRWRLYDQDVAPLTFDQAFYIATMGGGEFFGKSRHVRRGL